MYGVSARLEVINVTDRHGVSDHRINVSLTEGGNVGIPSIQEESEDEAANNLVNNFQTSLPGFQTASRCTLPQPVRHHDTETPAATNIDDPVSLDKAIQKNFTKLRDTFIVDEFIDYMFENDLLTRTELQQLETTCQNDKTKATKKVLMNLSARPVSKKFMLMALENTKQQFLGQLFFPEEEKE